MKQEPLNGKNGTHTNGHAAQGSLSATPFPASRKVYAEGTRPGVRVPLREITRSSSHAHSGQAVEPADGATPKSITVYDTSGVYTDPDVSIDIRQGLQPFRQDWIVARGDTRYRLRLWPLPSG